MPSRFPAILILTLVTAWPVGLGVYVLMFGLFGGGLGASPAWMQSLAVCIGFPWLIYRPDDMLGILWLGFPYTLLFFTGLHYWIRFRKKDHVDI